MFPFLVNPTCLEEEGGDVKDFLKIPNSYGFLFCFVFVVVQIFVFV